MFLIAASAKGFAAAPASIVEQLQTQRQAFAQDNKLDLRLFSQEVQVVVRDANALDQAGNDADAVARLQTLKKFAPLTQFPSLDVQMLCDRLYTKLSQASDAAGCRDRAAAMAEILQRRSGSGATPDDPVRVITISEIGEWTRSQAAKISDVSAYPYHDQNLQAITYTSPATAGKPAVAYFQFTPRLYASLNNTVSDVFAPLPVSPNDGKYQIALAQAHEQRVKFLNDLSFDYPELIRLCDGTTREAMQLAQRGDFNAALSKLGEVERIRPIREIPIYTFISTYSYLLGKAGNVDAQSNARLFLFGITQDIAHSGNGLTPENAVHVIATSEEYAWVNAKKMRVIKQGLIQKGDRRYDMIVAVQENGSVQTYYFEVSQVYAREGEELK
ncbi:DUF4919 domain-containing protein [Paraburkholderia sp. J76]|uniref:DUF4919 domain-containing protein n=1 Tax=Paraburkholderia sp. J76 TaxID=2805439 RepID=UPI002ABD2B87|nr:DUF4919 domain-containing protein [Paraburkholderia sp. J76]